MYGLLKGLRVVEGAAFIAGPSCGLHLAQLGAEVIRFEDVRGGPDSRRWPLAPESGASLYWEGLNKGKKSVAIDLSKPEGRELAQALATAPGANGGLFVTNYPPDGFLAYERLKTLRADLVCLRVMGWADGKPALDYTVNCAVGVPFMTGPADWPEPVNHALPAWDLLAGAYGAFALLAAERRRRDTGRGGEIRLPLSDIAAASLGHLGQVAEVALGGEDRHKTGNDLYGAFGRDFVTADGQRLMVTAITPRQWSSLVEALGLAAAVADLEAQLGVSFARDEGLRFVHRQRLLPLFVDAFQASDAAALTTAFDAAGVTWGLYQTLSQALAGDPRLFAGNPVFDTAQHPSGAYLTPGAIATLAGETRGAPPSAPRLGQHTDEVLADVLGMASGEIGRLRDAGLVAG